MQEPEKIDPRELSPLALAFVGDIMESYPIVPMTLGLILVTLVVTWYLFRRDLALADRLKGWRWKAVAGPAYIAAVLLAVAEQQKAAEFDLPRCAGQIFFADKIGADACQLALRLVREIPVQVIRHDETQNRVA